MAEDEITEGGSDATVLVLRVAEWAAWFPMDKDEAEPNLQVAQGMTMIEVQEGERLSDLEVMKVPNAVRHLPVESVNGSPAYNQKMALHAFRATFASLKHVPRAVMEDQQEEKPSSTKGLVMPPGFKNREQRRKER